MDESGQLLAPTRVFPDHEVVYEREALSIEDGFLFGIGVERRVAIRGENVLHRQKKAFQHVPVPGPHAAHLCSAVAYCAGGQELSKTLVEPQWTGGYTPLDKVMDELVKNDFIVVSGRGAEIEGDVVFVGASLEVTC